MVAWFRSLFSRTPVRLSFVLWLFGYLLVDIGAHAMGRAGLGVTLLADSPLLVLGVTLSLLVGSILDRWDDRSPVLKWSAIAVALIVAGAVLTLADYLWLKALALTIFPSWVWALKTDPGRLMQIYILYGWTLALSLALIWAARSSDVAKLNEARAAAFEAAASRAEAAALRLQLNPHFLFNTLNGIASLVVHRKSAQAEEMIGRLADFLRSSLAADPNALIPLSQELATVRSYLHIEEARFGDRMQVGYDIAPGTPDVPVPNFLLQPLIENAVKFGLGRSRGRAGSIEVSAKLEEGLLLLTVVNRDLGAEGKAKRKESSSAAPATGLGLANTRQRLQGLYGERAWVDATTLEDGFCCRIGLPTSGVDAVPALAR
jgi:signal transduction histidine kinase